MPVVGELAGQGGVGNGGGEKAVHLGEDDEGGRKGDGDVYDGEVGEVREMGKERGGERAEGGDAGEGAEGGGERRGEAFDWRYGAAEEGERAESVKGAESGGGELQVGGAVGEAEGDEVAERGGGVACGRVVVGRWVAAGVPANGEAHGLESS